MLLAKFYVEGVHRHGYANYNTGEPQTTFIEVTLNAVHAPDDPHHANAGFAQATPTGELKMRIDNPNAFDYFKEGEYIYLPFLKAEEAARFLRPEEIAPPPPEAPQS